MDSKSVVSKQKSIDYNVLHGIIIYSAWQALTLVLLNHCKLCRSRSVGFWWSQLIWICTVCHLISKLIATIWIKQSDWLKIRNGCGILIYSAWQALRQTKKYRTWRKEQKPNKPQCEKTKLLTCAPNDLNQPVDLCSLTSLHCLHKGTLHLWLFKNTSN